MTTAASTVDRLLRELENGLVVPQRYSRRSLYGRYEPLLATTVLAFVAVIGSVLLHGLTAPPSLRR